MSLQRVPLRFSALHFLTYRDGRSERLHGHDYRVGVCVHGGLGPDGYVVDFRALRAVTSRLCTELHRRVLVPGEDSSLRIERAGGELTVAHAQRSYRFPAEEVALLPLSTTTTEVLAGFLAERLASLLAAPGLSLLELCLAEAVGQSATARLALDHGLER